MCHCSAVCRHVFEVAAQRVWNFRGSPEEVTADLRRFCTTEPEFSDPAATGRQAVGPTSGLPSQWLITLSTVSISHTSRRLANHQADHK
eukprot:scaffold432519_cov43-Prasinocladus_malaysianus.AAC.1